MSDGRPPESGNIGDILRASLRGFLAAHWSIKQGRAAEPAAVRTMWSQLVGQGLASLGYDRAEGGLAEIVTVSEELGRAACPVPFSSVALVNLAFAENTDPFAIATAAQIRDGTARMAFAFGHHDPDPNAGRVSLTNGALSGHLRFVEAAASCTHLAVPVNDRAVAVVALNDSSVSITSTRAMGAMGLFNVSLDGTPAQIIELDTSQLHDLVLQGTLIHVARAYGAARCAFDGVVAYAKERQQFGQPIGRFQAVQHKLADAWTILEGVRLTVRHAAALNDAGDGRWRFTANAATAFAGDGLRRVALETQHVFGAIGYAEEHDASLHFKRVHVDTLALGGAVAARRRLASFLFDDGGVSIPRTDLGTAGNALRDDIESWLERNWSGARKTAFDALPFAKREFDADFARRIGETGWIGLNWPRKFGGQARSPREQLAFMETMEHVEAPRIGAAIQANALMMFGTTAQQEKYLPEILRGEAMHGMGYSEPQAGSDLAALRTSAKRDGDDWVINGQKIWTTTWWGKYMFLAARTDPKATPPHAGISMFIVPMDTPGITVRPATTMYDGTFANIFYDDVRIPLESLVGEINGGWKVLTGALAFERGLVGGGIVLKVAHAFEQLRLRVLAAEDGAEPLAADPLVRDRMAKLAAEIEVGRQLMMYCADLAENGVTPPEYGAMSKVYSGELMERFGEAALDILGMRATISEQMPDAIDNGRFEQNLRHSLMWVISIGTNEIQRSLMAQRGLGLPR